MKNIKLTPAQQKVMEQAYAQIDYARTHNFYDWYRNGRKSAKHITDEEIDKRIKDWNTTYPELKDYHRKSYEGSKNGEAIIIANTKTLNALVNMGLIKIIELTGTYTDTIQVLNY